MNGDPVSRSHTIVIVPGSVRVGAHLFRRVGGVHARRCGEQAAMMCATGAMRVVGRGSEWARKRPVHWRASADDAQRGQCAWAFPPPPPFHLSFFLSRSRGICFKQASCAAREANEKLAERARAAERNTPSARTIDMSLVTEHGRTSSAISMGSASGTAMGSVWSAARVRLSLVRKLLLIVPLPSGANVPLCGSAS